MGCVRRRRLKRDNNKFHKLVEDSLLERQEMQEWLAQARRLALIEIRESDWYRYGHMEPEDWLMVPDDDEFYLCNENDIYDEEPVDTCRECGKADWNCTCLEDAYFESFHDESFYDDLFFVEDFEPIEPGELSFGGVTYPIKDVIEARKYLRGETFKISIF